MKALILLAILPALLLAGEGRYQLASGLFETSKGAEHVTLKIDTVTGDTWQLMEVGIGDKSGSRVVGWVAVFDDAITSAQSVQRLVAHNEAKTAANAATAAASLRAQAEHMAAWAEKHLLTGGSYVSLSGDTNTFTAAQAAKILETYKTYRTVK